MLLIYKKDLHQINNFTIYGERHSGTNLLERLVTNVCSVPITWELGYKHFFGLIDKKKIIESHNTLFIGIVRNPYDWISAMFENRYHIPRINEESFEKFILNEWYSIDDYGKEIIGDRHYLLGRKYKNIFEMRKCKLQYITEYMPILCDNLCLTTYEYITDNTAQFTSILSKSFRLENNLSKLPTIWDRKKYSIEPKIKKIIDTNISWDIEQNFGFMKRSA